MNSLCKQTQLQFSINIKTVNYKHKYDARVFLILNAFIAVIRKIKADLASDMEALDNH